MGMFDEIKVADISMLLDLPPELSEKSYLKLQTKDLECLMGQYNIHVDYSTDLPEGEVKGYASNWVALSLYPFTKNGEDLVEYEATIKVRDGVAYIKGRTTERKKALPVSELRQPIKPDPAKLVDLPDPKKVKVGDRLYFSNKGYGTIIWKSNYSELFYIDLGEDDLKAFNRSQFGHSVFFTEKDFQKVEDENDRLHLQESERLKALYQSKVT